MTMKKLIYLCCVTLVSTALAAGEYSHEIPVSSGERLVIELETGGSIQIQGWSRDVVSIQARFTGRDHENVRFRATRTADGVRIVSDFKRQMRRSSIGGQLEVKVPERFDLDLNTAGGEIEIDGVDGEIRGRTMGGELRLTHLRGKLELSTMGGRIQLSDSAVDGSVETMGGDVLLSDVLGNVEASTQGGKVIYDNVQVRRGSGPCSQARISTMGGDIKAPEAPCGADVQTMGGNIRVDNAGEFVKAETMGGNITIGAVDGWIKAITMGGRIEATMVGDPSSGRRDVRLDSRGGDITLTLPDGMSMTVDITLAYTKRSRQDYTISSDFPLTQNRTDSWDYGEGSPRKYIYSRGKIGDGEHKVRISTINGNVRLIKGN